MPHKLVKFDHFAPSFSVGIILSLKFGYSVINEHFYLTSVHFCYLKLAILM